MQLPRSAPQQLSSLLALLAAALNEERPARWGEGGREGDGSSAWRGRPRAGRMRQARIGATA
eukprot:2359938-Pleurochrysis_carterae.AAC.3